MRSGTTLLGNMLHGGSKARHPEISFAPDTITDIRDITPIAAAQSQQDLPLMNKHVSPEFFERWTALATEVLPGFESKVLAIAPSERPQIYGGKLTGLLPELLALSRMPELDSRFLILERDPRDIFASAIKRYGETPEAPLLAFMNAALTLDYANIELPNSMRVSYGELVSRPAQTMGDILDFIGVDRATYDWPALDTDLISNSSFIGIGPDDLLTGAGIRPSIGQHRQLDPYFSGALAEFFAIGTRPPLRTRLKLHEEFLPEVLSVASRYGYAMDGLRASAAERRGFIVPLLGALKKKWTMAREKFAAKKRSLPYFIRRK